MRVFIGCSSEKNDKAKTIVAWLKDRLPEIHFVLWFEWFADEPNNEVTWEGIYKAAHMSEDGKERLFDSAIMLFSGDDKSSIRGIECLTTRDNVILETGVFAGCMGKERVFILADNRANYHFPSDFEGLNKKHFDYTSNFTTSVNRASLEEIAKQLQQFDSNELRQNDDDKKNPLPKVFDEMNSSATYDHTAKLRSHMVKNF